MPIQYLRFCLCCLLGMSTFFPLVAQNTSQSKLYYKLSAVIQDELAKQTEAYRFQLNSWEFSYIGEYYTALKTWDDGRPKSPKITPEEWTRFQYYQPQAARPFILKAAASRQITIINEAHHQPPHRLFTKTLLQDFYELGYRYLGFETLNEYDSLIQQRKYPIQETGTYSKEPQFGDLIRMALEMGYQIFPYEATGNGRDREIGQARNIQKVLDKNPGAKLLLHCGFAHAFKDKYPAWEMAMAGRLKEYTGIDPLTIDQTNYTESGSRDYENPLYKALEPTAVSVYVDSTGNSYRPLHLASGYDIMVFHPRSQLRNGRPSWMFQAPHLDVKVKMKGKTLAFPNLLMAYPAREDPKVGVPADIVAVSKAETVHLALRKGIYQLVVQTAEGTQRLWKKIKVN